MQEHRGDHREVHVLSGKQRGAVIALVARGAVASDERLPCFVDGQRATLRELAGDRGELEVEADLAVDAHRAPIDLHDVCAPQG